MTVAYWVVAGLLAVFYLYSGGVKAVRSPAALRPMMAWVDSVPVWLLRTVGVLEVAGAAGLLLPGLAVPAAAGLVLLQVGATVLHLRRGEVRVVWLNAALLVLAAVAGWLAIR
jgi:uncharacterized membrane protein